MVTLHFANCRIWPVIKQFSNFFTSVHIYILIDFLRLEINYYCSLSSPFLLIVNIIITIQIRYIKNKLIGIKLIIQIKLTFIK